MGSQKPEHQTEKYSLIVNSIKEKPAKKKFQVTSKKHCSMKQERWGQANLELACCNSGLLIVAGSTSGLKNETCQVDDVEIVFSIENKTKQKTNNKPCKFCCSISYSRIVRKCCEIINPSEREWQTPSKGSDNLSKVPRVQQSSAPWIVL